MALFDEFEVCAWTIYIAYELIICVAVTSLTAVAAQGKSFILTDYWWADPRRDGQAELAWVAAGYISVILVQLGPCTIVI